MKEIKNKQLKLSDIRIQNTRPIFLNHDLTKYNADLFKIAREFKNNNNFKFIWIKKGSIFLRESDTSKIIRVDEKTIYKTNYP